MPLSLGHGTYWLTCHSAHQFKIVILSISLYLVKHTFRAPHDLMMMGIYQTTRVLSVFQLPRKSENCCAVCLCAEVCFSVLTLYSFRSTVWGFAFLSYFLVSSPVFLSCLSPCMYCKDGLMANFTGTCDYVTKLKLSWGVAVPAAAIHTKAKTLPPSRFIDDLACFGSWAVPALLLPFCHLIKVNLICPQGLWGSFKYKL